MSRPISVSAIVALATIVSFSSTAQAEEVRWRSDYNAARREATQTGQPLVLDFGTEACVWCKRLDATTFRAPAVVERLNTQFISVKVDGNRAAKLVEALGIQSFPTLIVAAPNGAILARQEGYLEAPAMARLLDQTLTKMPRPQTVVPASATATTPATAPVVPAALRATDPAREEIARKLTQVYLDRGLDLCRRGRTEEGAEYFALAASLSPHTPEAATARELIRRVKAGEELPRS